MKKRIFPILYCIIFILTITGCGAQNSQEAVPEDTEITLETTTVDGQEYYLLTSVEDLNAIGEVYPLSENYMLANDITMSGEWDPLGNSKNPFTGIFDGNGYTIYDLTAAPEANGFFPMVHYSTGTEIEECYINAGTQAQKCLKHL